MLFIWLLFWLLFLWLAFVVVVAVAAVLTVVSVVLLPDLGPMLTVTDLFFFWVFSLYFSELDLCFETSESLALVLSHQLVELMLSFLIQVDGFLQLMHSSHSYGCTPHL